MLLLSTPTREGEAHACAVLDIVHVLLREEPCFCSAAASVTASGGAGAFVEKARGVSRGGGNDERRANVIRLFHSSLTAEHLRNSIKRGVVGACCDVQSDDIGSRPEDSCGAIGYVCGAFFPRAHTDVIRPFAGSVFISARKRGIS